MRSRRSDGSQEVEKIIETTFPITWQAFKELVVIEYPLYATEAHRKLVDDLVAARRAEGLSLDDLDMPRYLAAQESRTIPTLTSETYVVR